MLPADSASGTEVTADILVIDTPLEDASIPPSEDASTPVNTDTLTPISLSDIPITPTGDIVPESNDPVMSPPATIDPPTE